MNQPPLGFTVEFSFETSWCTSLFSSVHHCTRRPMIQLHTLMSNGVTLTVQMIELTWDGVAT